LTVQPVGGLQEDFPLTEDLDLCARFGLSASAHFSRVQLTVTCTQIQRKSRVSPPKRPTAHQNRPAFQWLALKIRYLADQRNFSSDQRIKAARTSEYQWNSAAAENTAN
jgi:hypothetical protein